MNGNLKQSNAALYITIKPVTAIPQAVKRPIVL